VTGFAHGRGNGVNPKCAGWAVGPGAHSTLAHAKAKKDAGREEQGLRDSTKFGRGAGWRVKQNKSFSAAVSGLVNDRNRRTVWTVAAEPFPEAHFATFPPALIKPCVLAGCPTGGGVLDPFMGAGTTALVAAQLNRTFYGIELNPEYKAMAEKRVAPELAQGKFL
jgi:DNA modification methylase